MRIRTGIASVMLASSLALTGCGWELPDPCADAPIATQDQIDQAAAGFEIEWEDCELTPSGDWTYDT